MTATSTSPPATTSTEPCAPGTRPERAASASTGWPLGPPSISAARVPPRTTAMTCPRRRPLLGRASALLPREAPERIELVLKLAGALVSRGEVVAAQQLLADASTIVVELGDARLAARTTLATGLTLLMTDAAVPPERMLRDIEDAVPVLEQAGDYEGLAMAEALRFNALDR